MAETTFVIGACKSGKSRYAQEAAEKIDGNRKIFIATCVPGDVEMEERVARHQKDRGDSWETVEAPIELPEAVVELGFRGDVLIVDCLTLWISNLLLAPEAPGAVSERISGLIQALEKVKCPLFVVSNEVGAGIVPENRLARQFRDLVGQVNQAVARQAGQVIFMVSGIPVPIKSVKGKQMK